LDLRVNLTRQRIDMSNGTAHAIVTQPQSVGYSLMLLFPTSARRLPQGYQVCHVPRPICNARCHRWTHAKCTMNLDEAQSSPRADFTPALAERSKLFPLVPPKDLRLPMIRFRDCGPVCFGYHPRSNS
jgi:hypothetical protein